MINERRETKEARRFILFRNKSHTFCAMLRVLNLVQNLKDKIPKQAAVADGMTVLRQTQYRDSHDIIIKMIQ